MWTGMEIFFFPRSNYPLNAKNVKILRREKEEKNLFIIPSGSCPAVCLSFPITLSHVVMLSILACACTIQESSCVCLLVDLPRYPPRGRARSRARQGCTRATAVRGEQRAQEVWEMNRKRLKKREHEERERERERKAHNNTFNHVSKSTWSGFSG